MTVPNLLKKPFTFLSGGQIGIGPSLLDIGGRGIAQDNLEQSEDFNEDQFIVKEPLTVILSEQGWVRTQKNHLEDDIELKYREGDKEKFRVHALTTDKIIFFVDNGRFFSVPANKLPVSYTHLTLPTKRIV